MLTDKQKIIVAHYEISFRIKRRSEMRQNLYLYFEEVENIPLCVLQKLGVKLLNRYFLIYGAHMGAISTQEIKFDYLRGRN